MGVLANIKAEPMVVLWGEDLAQVEKITCAADVADSLDGKYFFIYTPAGAKYHVWFNTSGGSAVNPAPAGSTAVEVALTTGDSASAVATAVAAALHALTPYGAAAVGAVVTVTHAVVGYSQPAHEGVGSGFSFDVSVEGDQEADVGFIDGDIEVEATEDLVDVTAHEHGSNVLSQIRTGKQVQLSMVLKETSPAQVQRILRQSGGVFTPVGSSGTAVAGWGTSKDFSQTVLQAKKLRLHPKVLGSGDRSRDYTFHLAYPIPESFNFSGESIHQWNMTFKVYPKLTLNDRVEYFSFGDSSQSLV
jgi:hypothetical protein